MLLKKLKEFREPANRSHSVSIGKRERERDGEREMEREREKIRRTQIIDHDQLSEGP